MQVIKNFLNSEKAIASGALVVASCVMFGLGKISAEQWMQYTEHLLGIYVGGKTVQGAVSAWAANKQSPEAVEAKKTSSAAEAELEETKAKIESSDDAADAALEEKFGDKEE